MTDVLTDRSATALVSAIERNAWSGWANFGRWTRGELYESPDALWYATEIPFVPYNGVLRASFGADAEQRIDDILGAFRARGRDPFWLLSPSSRPEWLGSALETRDFVLAEELTGMAAPLEEVAQEPLPPGVEIHEVSDDAGHTWVAHAAAERWGVEAAAVDLVRELHVYLRTHAGVSYWIATVDGRPMAKAVTYPGGGVVGLYGVVTLPEARGMGLGSAVTVAALKHAQASGLQIAILHSTPMAVGLYERLGFKRYCPLHFYLPRAMVGDRPVHP